MTYHDVHFAAGFFRGISRILSRFFTLRNQTRKAAPKLSTSLLFPSKIEAYLTVMRLLVKDLSS